MRNGNYVPKNKIEGLIENGLYENNNLLNYCPNYNEEKEFLKSINTINWEEISKYIDENYKSSNIYQFEQSPNFEDGKVQDDETMKQEVKDMAKVRYVALKELFDTCKNKTIPLYDLIEYIINYPTTYPAPKEEEMNFELECLMEEYDIIVRYHLGDIDGLQIQGEAIKRLITTINQRDVEIKKLIPFINNLEGYVNFKNTKQGMIEATAEGQKLFKFPLSYAQEKGESIWQKGRGYQVMHYRSLNGDEETKKFVMRLQKIMDKNN